MSKLFLERSERAEEDLIEIWLHIAADNPAAADRVLDRIDARCTQLVSHPHSGSLIPELGLEVRHLVVGQYVIFYRVADRQVTILRVRHGRREISAESFDD